MADRLWAQTAAAPTPPALTGAAAGRSFNAFTVNIPATAKVGDTALLVLSSNNHTTAPSLSGGPAFTLLTTITYTTAGTANFMRLYSRTLIAADIGTGVTVANNSNFDTYCTIRTYTCKGVDRIATTTGTTVSAAPVDAPQSKSPELQVNFFSGNGEWFQPPAGSAAIVPPNSNVFMWPDPPPSNTGRPFNQLSEEFYGTPPFNGGANDLSTAGWGQIVVSLLQ